MNDRGFTLIELLAVIVVLSIIALITVPVMFGTVNDSKKKLNSEQKLAIENAAREWGIKNLYINDENVSVKKISVKKLQDEGYLDKKGSLKEINIDNLDKAGVCISFDSNQYVYTYTDDVENCS